MSELESRKTDRAAFLLREYAISHDTALRNEIVTDHLGIASMIAARFSGKGVDYDDLYQVASLALVKAVERFDIEQGVKFSTYAIVSMTGEVKNYFRDRSRAMRLPRGRTELLRRIDSAAEQFLHRNFRQPTPEELAEKAEVSVEDVIEALEMRGALSLSSLDATYAAEDEGASIEQFLGIDEKGYSEFEESDAIQRAMRGLDERQRQIIRMKFFEGLSQREIAERLGTSQMSVSRAERRALAGMRANMTGTEE